MTKEQLDKILLDHAEYLINGDISKRANLYGVNLRGVSLRGVDLSKVSLYGVDLGGADLSGVSLYGVNLYGVKLYGTNLSGASFYGAKNGDKELIKCSSILGLKWNILIFDDIVRVGCQEHTYKEWLSFTEEQIKEMHSDALDFYPLLISILKYEYKGTIFEVKND